MAMQVNWKRFAVKQIKNRTFSLSFQHERELAEIVKGLPIEWHPTTPRKFECQPGCFNCCSMCWFNEDELSRLPEKYHSGLRDGRHVQDVDGKCIFYKETSLGSYHCTIPEYRPLRCRIYPFHPILDTKRNAIVILAQDVMIWLGKKRVEPASLCYGLGNGDDVSGIVGELCREYLVHSILEQSHSRVLWMGDADKFIDKRALALRERPLYKTFAECHNARMKAIRLVGPDRFRHLIESGLV